MRTEGYNGGKYVHASDGSKHDCSRRKKNKYIIYKYINIYDMRMNAIGEQDVNCKCVADEESL